MKHYFHLPPAPNQFFEVQQEGHLIEFRLHMFRDRLFVSAKMDGEVVLKPRPVVGNTPLLDKTESVTLHGNFMFEIPYGGIPDYEKLGTVGCQFVFVTEDGDDDV